MSVSNLVEKRGKSRPNLIQILHDLQQASGDNSLHVQDLEELANIMGIHVSEIVSTASFYTMFSLKPRGKHIIRLCESPPCYIMGEENILNELKSQLGVEIGETTTDKIFTLETSSCLGVCGVAPAMMIDDTVYGNLTPEKIANILQSIVAQEQDEKN